jgi:hypothetical protein
MTNTDIQLAKNITLNQVFGQLTAIGTCKKANKTYIICQCSCGKIENLTPGPIRNGKRVRCSECHIKWLHDRSHLIIDRTGEQHGKLLLVERLQPLDITKDKATRYRCLCDCGNEVIIRDTSIMAGAASCGCSKYGIQNKQGFRKPVEAAWNNIYSTYKSNAFKRGIEFHLTKEHVKELCSSNCGYCGIEPSTKYWQKAAKLSEERVRLSTILVNGIDRVDPTKGYTNNNTVPCCKTCNYAKLKMSVNEFKEWISRVYKFLFESQQNDEY